MDKKAIALGLNGTYQAFGIDFKIEVAPCCWMYNHYPFQIQWKAFNDRCQGHITTKLSFVENINPSTIVDILKEYLSEIPCDVCGKPNYVNIKDNSSNRGKTCDECFVKKVLQDYENENKKSEAKEKKQDEKMKKKGFKFKTIAWIHPKTGGDDFQVIYYTTVQMSDKEIEKKLKTEGSRVLNDYKTVAL